MEQIGEVPASLADRLSTFITTLDDFYQQAFAYAIVNWRMGGPYPDSDNFALAPNVAGNISVTISNIMNANERGFLGDYSGYGLL